jgi:hypothetical protein
LIERLRIWPAVHLPTVTLARVGINSQSR